MSRDTYRRAAHHRRRKYLLEREDVIVYEQDGSRSSGHAGDRRRASRRQNRSPGRRQGGAPRRRPHRSTRLRRRACRRRGLPRRRRHRSIVVSRLDRILSIDLQNRLAIVEPGVIQSRYDESRLQRGGFFYAPTQQPGRFCSHRRQRRQATPAAAARTRLQGNDEPCLGVSKSSWTAAKSAGLAVRFGYAGLRSLRCLCRLRGGRMGIVTKVAC